MKWSRSCLAQSSSYYNKEESWHDVPVAHPMSRISVHLCERVGTLETLANLDNDPFEHL